MSRNAFVRSATAPIVLGAAALLLGAFPTEAPAQPGPQIFDHLKCMQVKDSNRKASYTADLTPEDPTFPPEFADSATARGCRIKADARFLCTNVEKANATDVRTGGPPPGAPAGPNTGEYLCYKLKCPKEDLPTVTITDQFGTRQVDVRRPGPFICAPATRSGAPTPTPGATATPTSIPTATATPGVTPTPVVTPTAEPTDIPTPTPEPTDVATPTPEPTDEPTPTPEPTDEPTPTPEPTDEPTPTPEPTVEPTVTPTPGSVTGAFIDGGVVYF